MNFFAIHPRRCTRARRTSLVDNQYLVSALRTGKAEWPEPQYTPRQAEQLGLFRGYYLRSSDGRNHWFGATAGEARANFEPAKARFLSKKHADSFEVQFSAGHSANSWTAPDASAFA